MRKFSKRFGRLGTETAFAVGADAAAWASQGNTVYPFHLGDINLPTPKHIVEAAMAAIKAGKTGYAPGAGIMPLRENWRKMWEWIEVSSTQLKMFRSNQAENR